MKQKRQKFDVIGIVSIVCLLIYGISVIVLYMNKEEGTNNYVLFKELFLWLTLGFIIWSIYSDVSY